MSVLKVVVLCTFWLFCRARESSRQALTLNVTELTEEAVALIENNSTYVLPVNNDRYFANLTSNDSLSNSSAFTLIDFTLNYIIL